MGWSERYAPQPEILRYANHVADRFDLRRDIQFDTRVHSATFDEAEDRWVLEVGDGERVTGTHCPRTDDGLPPENSGSQKTRRWSEGDSNPRSPVPGRGQATRNQIFRRTTGAEAYVRRNKAAGR
jgi:hypothetical protein